MAAATTPGPGRRPRLLFYAMYDPSGMDNAPKVRIALMGAALERIADLERIQGGRIARARSGVRWLLGGGLGRVDAVYVESSTSTATPFDLALLLWARLRGRPVGVYFRDAYPLHRDLFPVQRTRQRVADLVWRVTTPMLRRIASRRFAPSLGLARILGLDRAVLLPPGTDPSQPNLGVAPTHLVVAVVAPTAAAGFDRLRAALELVRREFPDVHLRAVTSVPAATPQPAWIELVRGDRDALRSFVEDARLCVIPLPLTRYTELAVPVRLTDLLAFGKPIVVTDSTATRTFLGTSGAALLCEDAPEALAEAIGRVVRDDDLARTLAIRARAFAELPGSTWADRAGRVLTSLQGCAA